MKYSRFEALVLVVGGLSVLGSLFFSLGGQVVAEEIVAQLLLLAVLFSAVHWGRSGGFIAALAASGIYFVMRVPLVLAEGGLTLELVSLLAVRILTYGLIGIVGGELCTRIKYIFARLEGSASIDESSHIYNQRFIVRTLETAGGQFARYDTPYSVVVIELSRQIMGDLRVSKQHAMIRGVASYIRGDVRLVDEAGRLDDGRFLVVLPHTTKSGGSVVGDRLHRGVCDTLGALDDSVSVTVLGTPEDASQLVELRVSLAPQAAPDDAAAPVGEAVQSLS